MTDDDDPGWFEDQIIDRLRRKPRWRNHRLHWYGPKSHKGHYFVGSEPLRRARYRLYIPEEQYDPKYVRNRRDKYGPYVWIGTDCGWEWMATRPVLQHVPIWYRLFDDLHDRAHSQGRYAKPR